MTLENVDSIASIVAAAAVIYAAWKWRDEKRFGWKFDHAARIMTSAYRVQETVKEIRKPFIANHEINKAKNDLKSAGFTSYEVDTYNGAVNARAFLNRLNTEEVQDLQKEIFDCIPFARVIFGDELNRNLYQLCSVFSVLDSTAKSIIRHDDGIMDVDTISVPLLYPNRRGDDDPINGEVNECVEKIKKDCLPIIRKKTSWI